MSETYQTTAELKRSAEIPQKFSSPDWTLKGEPRATVALKNLTTLWINTGTLCNIECIGCYIESSPTNDRLLYITQAEVTPFLEEIETLKLPTEEIGFTGGEPFMNPDMVPMAEDALMRGFKVLILTNAMAPMQRPRIKEGLLQLNERFKEQLTLRVSLDHYSPPLHDALRGKGSFAKALTGLDWLVENSFSFAIAGRTCWEETESHSRQGYASLIGDHNWPINADDPNALVLFPEMDETIDVPEITTKCWRILNIAPEDLMCATSRMIVKHKGQNHPSVMPCTLLPFDKAFDMGTSLKDANIADGGMFKQGAVKLCHHHCAKFCVLGGGSCTA